MKTKSFFPINKTYVNFYQASHPRSLGDIYTSLQTLFYYKMLKTFAIKTKFTDFSFNVHCLLALIIGFCSIAYKIIVKISREGKCSFFLRELLTGSQSTSLIASRWTFISARVHMVDTSLHSKAPLLHGSLDRSIPAKFFVA